MTFRTFFTYFLSILVFYLFCGHGYGQSSQEPFGKNRVQYKNFKWKSIATYNFEIYYYDQGEDLARKIATYAEEDFAYLCQSTGYSPYDKTRIILYQSVSDQLQSNIGLADQEIMIGGQTTLVKSKLEIAFKGSQIELMEDLSEGIAHIMINNIMYGGGVKEVIQSSYLLSLPEWFVSGAAAYISKGWSLDMDDFVRTQVLQGKLYNPNSYSGEDARLIGQSVWNYLAQEFGEESVTNILNMARLHRNAETSIESHIGLRYKDFVDRWKAYYISQNVSFKGLQRKTEDSLVLIKPFLEDTRLIHLQTNSSGSLLGYSCHTRGKYKVKTLNLASGKKHTWAKGGYKRTDQPIDPNHPLIRWQDDNTLAMIYRKKDKLYFKRWNISSGKSKQQELPGFHQILWFDISQDGKRLILSADKTGQSDLFIMNTDGSGLVQITNDAYDDLTPAFVPGSYQFVFASNRTYDSLKIKKDLLPNYNNPNALYLCSSGDMLTKIYENGNCIYPQFLSSSNLIFLNDQRGILQLFSMDLNTKSTSSLTSNPSNINHYSIHNRALYYISSGPNRSLLQKQSLSPASISCPYTSRKTKISGIPETDSSSIYFSSQDKPGQENEIDFDKFVFESDSTKQTKPSSTGAEAKTPLPNNEHKLIQTITGPQPYRNPFSVDKINSTLLIDPLRGTGGLLEAGMSDLMGNHRMDGGIFYSLDFRSNKLFGEYRFVKKRMDIKARYDRQTLSASNEFASHKYTLNILGFTAALPISVNHRISVTPMVVQTRFGELTSVISIPQADKKSLYSGLKMEYVYDNTLVTGMNMIKGTRAKALLETYIHTQSASKDFSLFTFDFRHYQPIHREFTFAYRLSFGKFFGPSPKNFLLGGMDNWLLSNREFYSTINNYTLNNPLIIDYNKENSDLLFVRYATSMRGFRYNSQFGPNYILFNHELRLPIVKYLYNGSINSNFFRNLQLTGFLDVGATWTGRDPFSLDNNRNTQYISGNPFTATVVNYRSPFLIGYGGGFRSMLLGYYVKCDLAWGVQNQNIQPPVFYFTFGYDF